MHTPTQFEKSLETLHRAFPFGDYFPSSGSMLAQRVIGQAVLRNLPSGSILDFGSGPCDKSAALAMCGYQVSACDDLCDPWHRSGNNREKILEFASQVGIDFFPIEPGAPFPYRPGQFDLAMLCDIIEHFHDSPRALLCQVLEWIKPGGLLLITVPNAANLRKRAGLLLGRTNYPPYSDFFASPPPWRGHVREYVLGDLRALAGFMELEIVELRDIHKMLDKRLENPFLKAAYLATTGLLPLSGLRDTLLLIARKPPGWTPDGVLRTAHAGAHSANVSSVSPGVCQ